MSADALNTNGRLQRLAADVARSCHAKKAVLTCGPTVVAQWGEDAEFPIAVRLFGIGSDAFELQILDSSFRELSLSELATFDALTEVVRGQLELSHQTHATAGEMWVKDHVAVAADYMTDSLLLLLRDWTIQHVNAQFERVTSRGRWSVVGRTLWEAFPAIVGTKFEAEIRAAMNATVPRVFEQFNHASSRWFQTRAFPCKDGLGLLTIDITDRKLDDAAGAVLASRTAQSQRMESLGTLASGIAHDFNNILGAILGHVGLLKEQVGATTQGRESVEQIGIAGARARDLVQQILTFARATERVFVHAPLRPLIDETLQLVRSTLPDTVLLESTLTDEPLFTTLNSMEVQQVLMNLCTNAWQAMPISGGRIRVHCERTSVVTPEKPSVGKLPTGVYAQLMVSDTGTGIDQKTLPRLFEPFFTTKRGGHGTGLGLHVVSGIVTAHGGAVTVQSDVGVGSHFAVYLPAAAETDAHASDGPPVAPIAALGEHVACVDDDVLVLLMLQRILERCGFAVTAFHDPTELVEAIRADPGRFELLVTDYSMPNMNGLEVARAVRMFCPSVPVIVATGYVSEELRAGVQELGGVEILNKEHTFEELGPLAIKAIRART